MTTTPRSESTRAIWLVCIGVGLLFLVRGAFMPYAKPIFQNLGGFSYTQIAWLVTGYMFAQSAFAPFAGWYTDRTSVRIALITSIVCGLSGFLLISITPGVLLSTFAVFAVGIAFVLGRVSLNTMLVLHSSADMLRRSVAKRATLLNLGSFAGNSMAYEITARSGYHAHAIVLGLLHLPLLIGLAVPSEKSIPRHDTTPALANLKLFGSNRVFLADSLRRFATNLPYGCWGTIIPIYVIDQYHSNKPVWIVGLTSVCTTIVGAHFLAVHASAFLYKRGFKWEWWSMVSVLLYCAGLMLLMLASLPIMLPVAIVVFICGEVLMTPCLDETAKKHGSKTTMATCMGLLHLVDGFGRMLGAAFAMAVYGWMNTTSYQHYYWPVVVSCFLVCSIVLHGVAFTWVKSTVQTAGDPARSAVDIEQEQAIVP